MTPYLYSSLSFERIRNLSTEDKAIYEMPNTGQRVFN